MPPRRRFAFKSPFLFLNGRAVRRTASQPASSSCGAPSLRRETRQRRQPRPGRRAAYRGRPGWLAARPVWLAFRMEHWNTPRNKDGLEHRPTSSRPVPQAGRELYLGLEGAPSVGGQAGQCWESAEGFGAQRHSARAARDGLVRRRVAVVLKDAAEPWQEAPRSPRTTPRQPRPPVGVVRTAAHLFTHISTERKRGAAVLRSASRRA